eukprot:8665486-Prorocentrum_lima.AAC.1
MKRAKGGPEQKREGGSMSWGKTWHHLHRRPHQHKERTEMDRTRFEPPRHRGRAQTGGFGTGAVRAH